MKIMIAADIHGSSAVLQGSFASCLRTRGARSYYCLGTYCITDPRNALPRLRPQKGMCAFKSAERQHTMCARQLRQRSRSDGAEFFRTVGQCAAVFKRTHISCRSRTFIYRKQPSAACRRGYFAVRSYPRAEI